MKQIAYVVVVVELSKDMTVEVLVDDVIPLTIGLSVVGGVPEVLVELAISETSELSPYIEHAIEEQKEKHEIEHFLSEHQVEHIDTVGMVFVVCEESRVVVSYYNE